MYVLYNVHVCVEYCVYVLYVCVNRVFKVMGMWTRTSRSHDISGPVDQMSVLVVLDGGACPGALHAPAPHRRPPPHEPHAPQMSRHSHTHHATCTESAPRDPHDPSSVVPNNQTMERLPVRQATIGMVCRRYMLLEGGRVALRSDLRAAERGLGRPRAPRAWERDRSTGDGR